MKYVYVVTRIVKKLTFGYTEIPNIGVHSSFKKAIKHYTSVVNDRNPEDKIKKLPKEKDLGVKTIPIDNCTVLATYWSAYHNEAVRLEKWRVK